MSQKKLAIGPAASRAPAADVPTPRHLTLFGWPLMSRPTTPAERASRDERPKTGQPGKGDRPRLIPLDQPGQYAPIDGVLNTFADQRASEVSERRCRDVVGRLRRLRAHVHRQQTALDAELRGMPGDIAELRRQQCRDYFGRLAEAFVPLIEEGRRGFIQSEKKIGKPGFAEAALYEAGYSWSEVADLLGYGDIKVQKKGEAARRRAEQFLKTAPTKRRLRPR